MTPSSAAARGDIIVHVFGRTDVGRTREHNEDAFVVADLSTDNATLQPEVRTHRLGAKGSLFMVADGMGGAAAGEIASAMAVDIVLNELRTTWIQDNASDVEGFARALKRATSLANTQINAFATNHPEYRGMGTTATLAGLLGDTLYLAQVGDSRAYLIRDGVARQITKDQSLMQKLIEAGELTEEEAEHSERRNIILQALGPETTVKVDLTHQRIRSGDTLVLCSDGLSGQVSKDEIAQVVSEEPDLMGVCKRLIERANENGGPDNITVIAARFEGPGLEQPNGEDEVGHRVYPLRETGQTPAMGIDRLVSTSPTQPMDRISPEVPTLPELPALPNAAAGLQGGQADASRRPTAPSAPIVSPERRRTGMIVAIALAVILVLGIAWYVLHTARSTTGQTPAPTSQV